MEIDEQNTPAINANDHILEPAKKIVLTPIHQQVVPDSPDSFELNAERSTSAIANVPSDIEQTTTPMMPSASVVQAGPIGNRRRSKRAMAGIVTLSLLGTGALVTASVMLVAH